MRYKKKDNLVCEQIDAEIVIFDSNKEQFFEMDGVGSFIWTIIEEEEEAIVKKIGDEYDIDEETALTDLHCFIADLLDKQLIYRIEGK